MPDTGAPYFIPYVENTDLVRDWPGDSLDLANAIVAALEDIPVYEKRIQRFTGSGTWTVPAEVTYAIAHMVGGGGGVGTTTTGANGGASSVAFASGTVSAPGGPKVLGSDGINQTVAGTANTGQGAQATRNGSSGMHAGMAPNTQIVAAASVTPAATITVTVGAGGAAGSSGAAGGSGYVYIEYYEEA